MFNDHGIPTVAVFSHPNHELAVLGLLQRLRPNIIYLTDGGGGARVADSQKWLKSVDLLDQTAFLNLAEGSFYDSLCALDHSFYRQVADEVFSLLDSWQPTQILCDAVEFYNPIHDLALPIVRAAVRRSKNRAVFEVPLMHQRSGGSEDYVVQRLPASRRAEQIEIRLTDQEVDNKMDARDRIYTTLMDELGPVLSRLPRAHAALEVLAPASSSISKPGNDLILRYEWRGELRLGRGEVPEVITYQNHYLPVASTLLA